MELLLFLSIFIVIHGYGGYTIPLLFRFTGNKKNIKINHIRKPLHTITIVIDNNNEEVKKGEKTSTTGTKVTFWASEEIFETTVYSFEILSTRFREMAFLNKGLILTLTDMRDGHVDEKGEQLTVRYEYDGGIADFVKHLNSTRGETHKSIISFASEDKKNKISLEVSMQWNAGFSESVRKDLIDGLTFPVVGVTGLNCSEGSKSDNF